MAGGKWQTAVLILLLLLQTAVFAQEAISHQVEPGDTWLALSVRYGLPVDVLQQANPHLNQQRQPVIGTTVTIPAGNEQTGRLLRPYLTTTLLQIAAAENHSPWSLAIRNNITSPYTPLLHRAVLLPDETAVPQEFPVGFAALEVSHPVVQPGEAIGIRGLVDAGVEFTAVFDSRPMDLFTDGNHLVALTALGAFYGSGRPELTIQTEGGTFWSQPWQVQDRTDWIVQNLTLTGAAAQIDQESINEERARLMEIWQTDTAVPQWQTAFQEPINDYLQISAPFGARRSYNSGPVRSYHEGVDYSAYGGTAVYSPARGTVVLAEQLYVRGGAVIIDHGLGIYSGFYHMSSVDTAVGDVVEPGQKIGEVGTSGLSTGNHLHWDLLVNAIWVDAHAWRAQNMDCWILEGMGGTCEEVTSDE